MKKKILIPILVIALAIILFVPVPSGQYKDGGTREYTALTYKIVNWNRLTEDGSVYNAKKVYFFPKNFTPVDDLWNIEKQNVEHSFTATVIDINSTGVVVQPTTDSPLVKSSDTISFGTTELEKIDVDIGNVVNVIYTGDVMETYPLSVNAKSWSLSKDYRNKEYTEQWLDKETAEKQDNNFFSDIVITEIYSNCFFASSVIPMPYQIKLNGQLSDEWCVGDRVICTYDNTYYDEINYKVEADFLTVEASSFEPDENVAYKPVIYLYPKEKTDVSVKLDFNGKLTCTYPEYNNGWNVTASPDGTLTDTNGQTYNYLYWEGKSYAHYDLSEGFCIKGEDTAAFLEDALAKLGLNRREANEFIVYWLPLMERNPYNIISFQTDIYTDNAKLTAEPSPDNVIRVFMAWTPSDEYAEMKEQKLTAPERNGFTLVEWGGTKIN